MAFAPRRSAITPAIATCRIVRAAPFAKHLCVPRHSAGKFLHRWDILEVPSGEDDPKASFARNLLQLFKTKRVYGKKNFTKQKLTDPFVTFERCTQSLTQEQLPAEPEAPMWRFFPGYMPPAVRRRFQRETDSWLVGIADVPALEPPC